jgi:thiamine-phosphate pyrophosphorylase
LRKFIYLISPNKIYKNFYKDLKKVLKYKKVAFLQLRFKNINKKKILLISKKVKKITKNFNIKLIINDDLHAAILSKADGCHLGQNDGSIL